jgi:cyclophilin family peptidyl-prolyl cis-trans isomerase
VLKAGAGSGVAGAGGARSAPAADCAAGTEIADVDDLYDASDRARFKAERERRRVAGEDSRDMDMLMTSSTERSASLTSSAIRVATATSLALPPRATLRRLRWRRVATTRTVAKVTLHVGIAGRDAGRLRFELLCAVAPMACDNFLQLCRRGYYDGVAFHQSVRAFMLQGGDPTSKGTGGYSCWGGIFPDETDRGRASHDSRGALAMASECPHTNGSQFYVLYRPAPHLDGKHTVFGRLVGGTDTLRAIELVETDRHNAPSRPVTIVKTQVHEDPFWTDAEEAWPADTDAAAPATAAAAPVTAIGSGIGKYLNLSKRAKPT